MKPSKSKRRGQLAPKEDRHPVEERTASEEEEAAPPYISPIYRRDIVGSLPRQKIEEMRLISASWNAALMECPRLLPRIVHDMLEVLVGNNAGYSVNKRGYVRKWDGGRVGLYAGGMAFQQIRAFQRCCKEIQRIAGEELDGQRVYPTCGSKAVVVFRLYVYQRERDRMRVVTWRGRNKLTQFTAAALVHFLHHLDGRCVRQLRIALKPPEAVATPERTDAAGLLNARLFEVYRRARGGRRGLRLYAQDVTEEGRLRDERPAGEELMRTARQLARSVGSISSSFSTVDEVLQLLSDARPWCKKLRLRPTANAFFSAEHIDELVTHFKTFTDADDFKRLVPKFNIRFPAIAGWPSTCPSEAVREVVTWPTDPYGLDWCDMRHELDVNAANGGEGTMKLQVILNLCRYESGQESLLGVEVRFPSQ